MALSSEQLNIAKRLKDQWLSTKEIMEKLKGEPTLPAGAEWPTRPDIVSWPQQADFYKEDSQEHTENIDTINKPSESALFNFAVGSLSWNIETVWLIGSVAEIPRWIAKEATSSILSLLPDSLRNKVEIYLPEDYTKRWEWFKSILWPLSASTKVMEEVQRRVGADPEATSTNIGEFLTPDAIFGITTLLKSWFKKIPSFLSKSRTEGWDVAEWFVKFTGWLNKGSLEKDIKFLKDNTEQAIKEMNIEKADLINIVDEAKKWIPKVKKEELAKMDLLKKQIIEAWEVQQKVLTETAEASVAKWANKLDELANIAKTNIDEVKGGVKTIGWQYDQFVWKTSSIEWGNLADDFTQKILDTNAHLSKKKKDALVPVIDEITNIVDEAVSKNLDWLLKYEDLRAIRQNIDQLINWKTWDWAVNNFLKSVRNTFDSEYIAKQFPISKEVDAEYRAARTFLDDIKVSFANKAWTESTSFRGKLKNLWKPEKSVELSQMAKLLWMSDEELKILSKQISENLWTKTGTLPVNLKTISETDNIKVLERWADALNIRSDQLISQIKSAWDKNRFLQTFIKWLEADKQNLITSGWKMIDNKNFISSIFKVIDWKWPEADVARNILEKELWKENFLKLKIAKSVSKITWTPNERTIASMIFNTAVLKIPWLGIALRRAFWKPEKALEYILKRAKRLDERNAAEEVVKKLREWKRITEEQMNKLSRWIIWFTITKEIAD